MKIKKNRYHVYHIGNHIGIIYIYRTYLQISHLKFGSNKYNNYNYYKIIHNTLN